jgi:hypothetical protein
VLLVIATLVGGSAIQAFIPHRHADVKGRVGPGGIDGLLAIFERPTDA